MAASQWRFVRAISTWWNPANYLDAVVAESRLIRRFIDDDVLECTIRNVAIADEQYIHTLTLRDGNLCDSHSAQSTAPIVLAHGYGCAGSVFLPSLHPLHCALSTPTPPIHIMDWLGNGLSSRPPFTCRTTRETEELLVESLEAWRRAMGMDKMKLCAHSLGAYSSVVYALRYPQHIDHLILVSPVGLPQKPADWDERVAAMYQGRPLYIRALIRSLILCWELGLTPSDLLRACGPKGKAFLRWVVEKRLFRLEDAELKGLLSEYLYHILAMNGAQSGEYALNRLLMPGAFAYHPLSGRMGTLRALQRQHGFRIDFVYGESDWMDSRNARKLKEEEGLECEVHIVGGCGHQLLLENYRAFGHTLGSILCDK